MRIIVEGQGAWTKVDGEPCLMERGDLILTPSGKLHEHHHEGTGPIVWLDVLDLPLIYNLESSWATEATSEQVTERTRDKSQADYSAAGVVPRLNGEQNKSASPMLRYPWQRTRKCLEQMAADYAEGLLKVAYVNPENGRSLFPSIGFAAIMLRPGETVHLPKRTTPCVFHAVEGAGNLQMGAEVLPWEAADTLVAPGYSSVTLSNASTSQPTFLITADEEPLHQYLGVF